MATLPHGCGWSARRGRDIAIFGLLFALFLPLITRNVSSEPYVYDEADYRYAASFGFFANWSDTPTSSLADFARAGLHRDNREALSERIRGTNDVLFYRHFHGPLLHYFLIPVSRLGWSERAIRTALLAIPCVALAVVYFGCLWLAPAPKAIAALLAAMLFLTGYSVTGSTELAPHQLFALCSLASLILLLKAVAGGQRRYWYGAVVSAGLAFCTLEITIVLLATLAISGFVERRRWGVGRPFVAKSLAVFLATVLVFWPAALLRLSFVKAYAVLAYQALLRQSPWGSAGFLDTWRTRILASPLEWILIVLAIVALFQRRNRTLYPLGVFGVLMLAANIRVLTLTPRYSLVFVPMLGLLAGLALGPLAGLKRGALAGLKRGALAGFEQGSLAGGIEQGSLAGGIEQGPLAGLALVPSRGPLRRPASFAVLALAVAGLYGNAWYRAAHRPRNPNPRSAAVVTYIHQNGLENKSVLAPQADVPTLHFYFSGMRLRGYFGPAPAASDLAGFSADAIIPAAEP
jgi:hypothetical protein